MDNALKYSEQGGEIKVQALSTETETVIEIQDWGCGIKSINLPRLFERFYRVAHARSRQLGGTGLGLAIVKHLVSLHAGRIEAFNRSGGGTVFTVVLPRKIESLTGAMDEIKHQPGLTA